MFNSRKNKSPDKRVQRTLNEIKEAFARLLSRKTYPEITVREICDEAQIRRTTFYQHFRDKDALALWFKEEKRKEFEAYCAAAEDTDSMDEWQVLLIRNVLKYLDSNQGIVDVLLSSGAQGREYLDHFLRSCLRNVSSRFIYTGTDPNVAAFRAEFTMGGILASLRWWYEHDRPFSEEDLVQFFQDFMQRKEIQKRKETP